MGYNEGDERMFQVLENATGKIYTVYAVKESQFLIYDFAYRWSWIDANEFSPID